MSDPSTGTNADRRLAVLFPDDAVAPARPFWRRRRTVVIALGVVVALVVAGAVTGTAFGSSGTDYRTGTVGPEPVDSVLTGVATIEPIAQAAVAFPVAGTIASVNVNVGDPVVAGGVLASLDTQTLVQGLHSKQASLAQAQLTLEKALSGESVGTTSSGSTGSGGNAGAASNSAYRTGVTGTPIVLTAASPSSPSGAANSASPLAAAQQAVLAAQHQVDTAMQAANTAIASEATACAAFVSASSPATADGGVTATTTPDATACQQAIAAVQTAQQALATAQQALQSASSALDALLTQLATTPPASTPTTTPSTPTSRGGTSGSSADSTNASGSDATGSTGSTRTGGTGSSGGSSPSAADLVAYQASVDAATYAVSAAQQAVDAATISSPLAGTVVGVNMTVGDAVSVGSSTENVIVEGQGGYEISTSVSVADIPSVSVGQGAVVTPDGTHRALAGKVVAISLMPASTTSTATLYHVIVGLTDPAASLHDGATGTVAITTKHTRAALAVPTSAVTSVRGRHLVTVLDDGTASPVPVQIGVMGATWTEIKSGLHAGQQVVLADVSAPLPDSATASTSSTQGTTGRFGGVGGLGGLGGAGAGLGGRTFGGAAGTGGTRGG